MNTFTQGIRSKYRPASKKWNLRHRRDLFVEKCRGDHLPRSGLEQKGYDVVGVNLFFAS